MLEVASSAFEDALDRFAQFFISPLLKQTSAEK
jgi:secreted Zn-dependent insulinase-like peptidase